MPRVKSKKNKVVVGMSGGVDSSVAALLLKEQGYDVIGAFIKNWSEEVGKKQLCWAEDRRDALRVAAKLGIPFVTFDFEPEFRKHVVDYLYREYESGRTPNPDIMCNKFIKFPMLLREAKKLGADYMATGHYARLRQEFPISNSQFPIYELFKATDKTKDQSYFLYTLDQEILKHCLFPLGELTKKEVRKIAEKNNLATAKKPDSQGICFVGEMNMREFLRKRIRDKPGKILAKDGKIIGEHPGLPYYTIGQRQGIGIGGRAGERNEPLYVIGKDLKTNILAVGPADSLELFVKKAALEDAHWINPHLNLPPRWPSGGRSPRLRSGQGGGKMARDLHVGVKVRYRAADARATLRLENGQYVLYFDKPERAVTPGQSAVFYDGEKMLGGGVIG